MNAVQTGARNRALLEAKMARWRRELVGRQIHNKACGKTRTITDLAIRKGRLVAILDGRIKIDFERMHKMWTLVDE